MSGEIPSIPSKPGRLATPLPRFPSSRPFAPTGQSHSLSQHCCPAHWVGLRLPQCLVQMPQVHWHFSFDLSIFNSTLGPYRSGAMSGPIKFRLVASAALTAQSRLRRLSKATKRLQVRKDGTEHRATCCESGGSRWEEDPGTTFSFPPCSTNTPRTPCLAPGILH